MIVTHNTNLIAKVTGSAKFAEDYRAEGVLVAKLLLSRMPHEAFGGFEAGHPAELLTAHI